MRSAVILLSIFVSALVPSAGFAKQQKISVVTSLFPLYEFAREVGGEAVNVELLLPPGTEPHTWEPRPSDIIRIGRSDLFIYMGPEMEPWVSDILGAVTNDSLLVIAVLEEMENIQSGKERKEQEDPDNVDEHNDPHVWLDLSYAVKIVDLITETLKAAHAQKGDIFSKNSNRYKDLLRDLDSRFFSQLSACRRKKFVYGGHSAFGHLARRYGLIQIPVYGISPDSEPSPRQVAEIVKTIRRNGIGVVYFEELVNPRLAQVIAEETRTTTLVLNPGGNLTTTLWKKGVTFISLMEDNLINLKKGLECE